MSLTVAQQLNSEFISANSEAYKEPNRKRTTSNLPAPWRPPPSGLIKCNVDASYLPNNPRCGLTAIFRDNAGKVVAGWASSSTAPSPLVAEAMALLEAINMARNMGIESDCLLLVKVIRGEERSRELEALAFDILKFREDFRRCAVVWTNRAGNAVAHEVARLCFRNLLPHDWSFNPPPSLKHLLLKDCRI